MIFSRGRRDSAASDTFERALVADDLSAFPSCARASVATARALRPAAHSSESRRASLRADFMAAVRTVHGDGGGLGDYLVDDCADQHIAHVRDAEGGELRMADVEHIDEERSRAIAAAARASDGATLPS